MSVRLSRATFFINAGEHVFEFTCDPGNGHAFDVPVVTANVGEGFDAVVCRAHENLVTVLETMLERARALVPQA